MYLGTVKERFQLTYEGRQTWLYIGPSGCGKTQSLKAAPRLLSNIYNKRFGIVVVNCPRLNVPDSMGFMIPKHMEDGSARSVFTLPDYFVTEEGLRLDEYDGGVIIFDEYDKADIDVKKILIEASETKKFGPHKIPDTWVIWMTANRPKDRTGHTKDFDNAINRRFEINIQPHFESWQRDYAEVSNVLPVTIAFARKNQEIVFSDEPPVVQGPWCTARSLTGWDAHYQLARKFNDDKFPEGPVIMEEASGRIGVEAAGHYFNTMKLLRELPDAAEVFRSPSTTRIPTNANGTVMLDGAMLVTYELAHTVTKETVAACIIYMERMSKEFSITFANSALKRNPSLLYDPAMRKWVQSNAHLLGLISQA